MRSVHIEKVRDGDASGLPVLEALERAVSDTRRRAFEMFQRRGGSSGNDLEDWLRAERELRWFPPAELVEDENQFRLHLAVPGVEAGKLRVTVLPRAMIVRAETPHEHDRRHGVIHFCEFGERRLMRRFDLEAPIDVDHVTAVLDMGMLEVLALKSPKADRGRPVKVVAA